jgi:hypothetical protein
MQKDYYNILGIPANSTVDEIKRAYRKKARLFHPDINPSPDAKDLFIQITEAYDFLLINHEKIRADDQAYNQAMEDWRKYRQDRSRKRASAYARTSYSNFKNSSYYKSTRIFDGATIIIGFIISILVIVYTIFGYLYRLRHPIPGLESPSLFTFVMLLLLGLLFFSVTWIFFRAHKETSNKRKKRP